MRASRGTLCDVSGSVAALAQFFLLFIHALGEDVAHVRSFAFSGPLVAVTEIVRHQSIDDAFTSVMQAVGMRSSDYGRAFADFTDGYRDAVDRKTTVVILGNGRTNHADPRLDLVARIAQRARRAIWLNPEHRVAWAYGRLRNVAVSPAVHRGENVQSIATPRSDRRRPRSTALIAR